MLWLREIGHCSTRLEACGLIETNPDGHLLPAGPVSVSFFRRTENARKRNDTNTETEFCARRLEAIQGWPDPVLVVHDHGAVCGMPASS